MHDLDTIRVLTRLETIKTLGLSDRTFDRLEGKLSATFRSKPACHKVALAIALPTSKFGLMAAANAVGRRRDDQQANFRAGQASGRKRSCRDGRAGRCTMREYWKLTRIVTELTEPDRAALFVAVKVVQGQRGPQGKIEFEIVGDPKVLARANRMANYKYMRAAIH